MLLCTNALKAETILGRMLARKGEGPHLSPKKNLIYFASKQESKIF